MTKWIRMLAVLPAILLLLYADALGCDGCNTLSTTVLPNDRSHRIELVYRFSHYNGYVHIPVYGRSDQTHRPWGLKHDPALHTGRPTYSSQDFEQFMTADIRGTFFLHPRLQAQVIVPVAINSYRVDAEHSTLAGLGDMAVQLTGYPLWRESLNFSYRLGVRLGLKLPTGQWHTDNPQRDALFLPGTGSLDLVSSVQYACRFRKIGFQTELAGRWNGRNPYGYQVTPSYTTNTWLTLHLKKMTKADKRWDFVPQLGLWYEYFEGHMYQDQWVPGTGGQACYAQAGMEVATQRWGIWVQAGLPVWQELFGTQMGHAGRLAAGVYVNLPNGRKKQG